MKNLFKITGILAIITLIGISAFGLPEALETAIGISTLSGGSVLALVPWIVTVGTESTFKELTKDEIEALTEDEFSDYKKAELADLKGGLTKLVAEKSKATEERLKDIQLELNKNKDGQIDVMKSQLGSMAMVIERLKESGISEGTETFKSALKKAWDEDSDKRKSAIESRTGFNVTVKAEQTYGDINAGLDFAQMKPGVTDIPVRRPKIRDLFSSIPVSVEFLKYVEQDTVIRDAKNVAKCAAVVSTTKETIIVRSIETKVIKDMIDFCRLFIDDYPFMESRINRLLNQSLALRVDQQLLLGTGLLEETFSIDSTSSVFSAANPVCVLTASIQAPTMIDLILGMQTQIMELGQQEDYDPNVVLVNKCDWFKQVESRKDLNNNYIDGRVTMVNGVPFVGGMMVLWTPIVVADTMYVFDSTKGEVVDRQELVISVAFENKDNWEKQIASLQGYERINFLVPNNWKNAFMKTLGIAADLILITAP